MNTTLLLGDCLEVLKTLPENSVDSIVTDPPYHLQSIVDRFGKEGSAPAKFGTDGAYARASAGFMGQEWDGGDIAFRPETWAEVLRVLKPGGHLLSFGATRNYHRMAVAIEDAGFQIRDTIMWLYGTGFPKSHNMHDEWEGWGTALKPAVEPIVLARKPLSEKTIAENVLKWGTGALNIDGCRIQIDQSVDDPRLGGNGSWRTDKAAKNVYEGGYAGERISSSNLGRWPANVMHDGSDEVVEAFPSPHGAGSQRSGKFGGEYKATSYNMGKGGAREMGRFGDSGSAARFFYSAKASKKDRNDGLSEEEKNVHPTVKPTDLMAYCCRLVTPPGGTVLDPFMGSGSTGRGAIQEGFKFIGIEKDEKYFKIAEKRIAAKEKDRGSSLDNFFEV